MWETPLLAGIDSWEKLHAFSEDARIPRVWAFGKHKGKDIASTDRGYLGWCLGQADMDPYVKIACRMAMDKTLTP